jgi:Cu(I)/Ag(I) efflux system membrane protein CusA/SilA
MLATGIKTPVGVKIAGPDLAEIERIARRVETVLSGLPGTASVFAERASAGRYITVDIQRDQASRYGLNIDDVQEVVSTAIGGMDVTETVEGLERYPVNLRYPQSERDSIERLRNLAIVTPSGAQIPLSAVATLAVEDAPDMIRSENARPNGWIYVDIGDVDLGGYVARAREAVAEQVDLPVGYSLRWSGQFEYMERAAERLKVVVPVTVMLIVLLLFVNFRNVAEVLIILGTLPMALVGGVWLLYLLDYNLSVAVGVGFIALAGVAVEIGVVKLVYLQNALARRAELARGEGRRLEESDLAQAVIEGALLRVRPITMTITTLIVALLPIMLGHGTGSEVMRRIAAPMVGGTVSVTLLTLVVIPATFLLWQRARLAR